MMLVLTYATYKALCTEQAIIDGQELAVQKQYRLPLPDACVQLIGKCCCGLGVFWCQSGGKSTVAAWMDCVAACCSCWCPHLMVVRGLVMTTTQFVWKVLTAIAVIVPWILMLVFFGLCRSWIRTFNSAETVHYVEAEMCENPGYYALGIAMYLMLVGFTICFRNRVRESAGIEGSACEDVVLTIFCPHVTVYQSFYQIMTGGVPAQESVPQGDSTTGAIKDKGQV